jgi:hypothetical protein
MDHVTDTDSFPPLRGFAPSIFDTLENAKPAFSERKLAKRRRTASKKGWCFTWNNPQIGMSISTDKTHDWRLSADVLEREFKRKKAIAYAFQVERGSSGTPHFQGWVRFKKRTRVMEAFRFTNKIHWEAQRGSNQECITYVTKEESRVPANSVSFCEPKPSFALI